ncbi:hypothetical protein M9H77_17437 [Catharanthus roseus]|uniref:Uncharacterized protein n=1 Tax=Catharanthus roseus TaxID=4058 RepID=A0ACC0B4M7_CATRO|nr:hypothetical protein M9H77_17437 [Catharanthus roseus]
MVNSSCGGTFLHKTADEAWDLFEILSDNSQQHATSSRIGTSRQIGNRVGMYEVSRNIDISLKVDALSKKFDELLALNTLPINSPNVQGTSQFSPRISQTEGPIFKYIQSRLEKNFSRGNKEEKVN